MEENQINRVIFYGELFKIRGNILRFLRVREYEKNNQEFQAI